MSVTTDNKTYSSVDEMFEEFKKEDEKRFFLFKFIDKCFSDKGIFGFRPSYILFRPFLIISESADRIKYACQRVYRGWDDTVVWSIDTWLDDIMPQLLQRLIETKHGTPFMYFPNNYGGSGEYDDEIEKKASRDYENDLRLIIRGFNASKEMDDLVFLNREQFESKTKELQQEFEMGMYLLIKLYKTLWD